MRNSAKSLAELALDEPTEFNIISRICEWERKEYGEGKHRVPNPFYKCVQKNRTGFFVVWNDEELLGYADVWELPASFYSQLKVGTIDEESIGASCILARSEARSSLWYIGSIITSPELRAKSPTAGAIVFAGICNVLPSFFKQSSDFPAKILGVGSSPFGKKLLSRWGFGSVEADTHAIDLRPRYEKLMLTVQDANALYLGRREV